MSVEGIFGLFLVAISPFILGAVHGIDLQRALQNENIPCFVPRSVPINVTWLTSISTWYYPYMSVLDLYLEGVELSGKSAQDLREDELYYDACITYDLGPEAQAAAGAGGALVHGFGGQQRTVVFEPINGLQEFRWRVNRPGSTHGGVTYTTLTDNSTFHVSTTCQEGRMTWGAITTSPTLPPETVRRIYDHALSNGFKREHFTGLRYDSCPQPRRGGTGSSPPSSGPRQQQGQASVGFGQSAGLQRINLPQQPQSRPPQQQQPFFQWGRGQGGRGWSSFLF